MKRIALCALALSTLPMMTAQATTCNVTVPKGRYLKLCSQTVHPDGSDGQHCEAATPGVGKPMVITPGPFVKGNVKGLHTTTVYDCANPANKTTCNLVATCQT